MASKRYSRILTAARYYGAIDNYIKYIQDTTKRGSRVGTGTNRPKSKALFVDPFGIALATNQVVRQTASESAFTTYSSALGSRTTAVAPTNGDLIIPVADYKAARVVITTGRGNGVKATSNVTGLPYLKYGGKSTSLPFGRKDAPDTQSAAFAEIRTAILNITNGAIVTLQPEKI
jgi:hypothetical protein